MIYMNDINLQGLDADDNEKEYSLSDFKGQKIILYFYPKDNTSSCTQKACDFRDNINRLTSYSSTIGQYMYYELKLYLELHRILYQLEELKDKIYKIKQKIEINRDLRLDTRELTKMLSILYEAHFYYYSSFCEELDSAIQ